ncbi:tRNA pseudouridine(55) synthase TruB [Kocuria oceani]|uniref:tRNA pseudouridine synthase B n=1 Tax=Kocuria oceani TaxID=988827 RepID=A0ABV9THD6_9MICC|nr:tRNA pseudouridine(55) synthase TruB [Kocuria oceani]
MARAPHDVPSPDPSLPTVSGLVVVDKPAGWTSHDVVARMRRLAGTRKVGHAGTLDPMATGVLVVGVEKATRLLTWVVGQDKTYETTLRLGQATVTDDAEGELVAVAEPADVEALTDEAVTAAVARLTGALQQVPAKVSAIKVDGRRAYAQVRAGQDVELAARPVTVSAFDVHRITRTHDDAGRPVLDVEATVSCSTGTYVRALARDLGEALGVGGHLTALRRTRVGALTLEHASTLDELAADVAAGRPLPVTTLERAAAGLFPVRRLTAAEAGDLADGRRIGPSAGDPAEGPLDNEAVTAGLAPDGRLVALLRDRGERGARTAKPVLVFLPGERFPETPGPPAERGQDR